MARYVSGPDDMTPREMRRALGPILKWMGENLHQWAVVDTLKDFTSWGFWSQAGGEVYASIDGKIAKRVLGKLRAYLREAPDHAVVEVWDQLEGYEHHAVPRGGKARRPGSNRKAALARLGAAIRRARGGYSQAVHEAQDACYDKARIPAAEVNAFEDAVRAGTVYKKSRAGRVVVVKKAQALIAAAKALKAAWR